MEEKQVMTGTVKVWGPLGDPGPIGWSAFALTIFMLSIHNAGWAPDFVWLALAIFYGGTTQFIAGMFEFSRNRVLPATFFTTYGSFWLGFALYNMLYIFPGSPFYLPQETQAQQDLVLAGQGWYITGFFMFNTVYCVCALQAEVSVTAVVALLELAQIFLMAGLFKGQGAGQGLTAAGGYLGFFCSAAAFYASTAICFNNMAGREIIPVGKPIVNYWAGPTQKVPAEGPSAVPLTEQAPAEAADAA